MSTATAVAPMGAGRRIRNILRLHTVNLQTYLGIPWIIQGFAFFVSLVVALLIRNFTSEGADLDGMIYSWAPLSPLWYTIVVATQSIALTLPLALGLSATRRDFYLGTALNFLAMATVNAAGWTVLAGIESATAGFGIGMHHFTALWFHDLAPWEVFLSWIAVQFLVLAIGAAVTTVWMRWKATGLVIFFIGFAVLVLGGASFLVVTGTFLATATAIASWAPALGSAVVFGVGVLALALGWLVLRRAPSRS